MEIIKTNGVSFELVAGACCLIHFNSPSYSVPAQYKSVTLNIQSTGAKKFSNYELRYNGMSYMSYDGHAQIELTRSKLVAFNGNTYIGTVYAVYGDSQD